MAATTTKRAGPPSASSPPSPRPAQQPPPAALTGLRPEHLGPAAIAFLVIATVGPMAAIAGGSPVVFASNGAAAPATYLLAGMLFAVFSVGYIAMSRHLSNAGGFVAYIARGLGVRAGTSAAGITVVAYLAIICSLWCYYGVFVEATARDKVGIAFPTGGWIFATLILATAMTWRGVDVSLRVLVVLLLGEVASLLILVAAIVLGGGGVSGNSFAGFGPADIFGPGLGIAFLFAVACFTGFESTVVFSEEARTPRRTIPRAAYLAVGFIAIFYCVCTWAISNGYGVDNVGAAAAKDPAGFLFALATTEVGPSLGTVMEILVVTSFFAMLVGFQNMFSRYVFALGRAGALPRGLGVANQATGSPGRAAIAAGVAIAVIVGAFIVLGAKLLTLSYSLLALGTVGYLSVLTLTSVGILAFFARERVETGLWQTRIAPCLALAGLVIAGYLSIANYTTLLGGQGGSARWWLVMIPVAAVAGWGLAYIRGRKRAIDYAAELV